MRDFLKLFTFTCFILSLLALPWVLEYNACPKDAEMYKTEYKFIVGACYFKYNDKWLSASKYKQVLFINSLNVNDNSKTLLIKNIDK